MEPKLTCIIGFKNENKWIETTVKSIRESTENVDIILINDASTDRFNYQEIASEYNCRYYKNTTSKGVAGSRDIGVTHCATPYFILLDGHMKFPIKDWDKQVVKALEEHPNSIVTTNTINMFLKSDGTIQNEDCSNQNYKAFGAYIDFNDFLTSKWSYRKPDSDLLFEIPSVMGACYASSVKWWNHIKGLRGLKSYGEDESLMALKTWLLGGKCYILPLLGIAHLYRTKKPYVSLNVDLIYNKVILIEFFIENSTLREECYLKLKRKFGEKIFKKVMLRKKFNNTFIQKMKLYIINNKVMTLEEFNNSINLKYINHGRIRIA